MPCPKCGSRVQRQYMWRHDKNMHQGRWRWMHVCTYCSADKVKTYSTFLDWKNHLSDTHHTCIEDEYAAGFKLDEWGQLHELDGIETDQAYRRVKALREQYGRYQGQVEGQPPGPLSTIRLPHIKGSTPDKDTTLTESEPTGSERGGSGLEEGEAQEEGADPESFTRIRSRETDTESEDTPPRRESWRSTRGRETVLLTTPHPRPDYKKKGNRASVGPQHLGKPRNGKYRCESPRSTVRMFRCHATTGDSGRRCGTFWAVVLPP